MKTKTTKKIIQFKLQSTLTIVVNVKNVLKAFSGIDGKIVSHQVNVPKNWIL